MITTIFSQKIDIIKITNLKFTTMDNKNLEVGKIYDVVSQRKGKFKMQLTHQDETWATGVILKGKAKAICAYNEVEEGEEVTVLKSFTTFTAVA
jgi:hypothetical protein